MPEHPEPVHPDVTAATNHDSSSIFRPEVTSRKLSEMISSFMIPAWVTSRADGSRRKCASCDGDLDHTAVRGIAMCLNAQHIGDIQVEVMCPVCFSSYYLHFRKACSKTTDFCSALLGDAPKDEPVPMSSIPASDNNLADAIIADSSTSTHTCSCAAPCGSGDVETKETQPCQS